MVEQLSLRREQHDGGLGALLERLVGEDAFDRGEERLGLEHHAFAAAEGPVVHRAVLVGRVVPQVVDADVDEPVLARPADDAVLERPLEELPENGKNVKNHGNPISSAARRWSSSPMKIIVPMMRNATRA